MKYITGIHALNIPCSSVNTTGDWHRCGISWKNLDILESSDSVFGTYGIEGPKAVYMLQGASYYVANHIRACLDLIARGKFSVAQTMRNDYIGNEIYDTEIFDKIFMLRDGKN